MFQTSSTPCTSTAVSVLTLACATPCALFNIGNPTAHRNHAATRTLACTLACAALCAIHVTQETLYFTTTPHLKTAPVLHMLTLASATPCLDISSRDPDTLTTTLTAMPAPTLTLACATPCYPSNIGNPTLSPLPCSQATCCTYQGGGHTWRWPSQALNPRLGRQRSQTLNPRPRQQPCWIPNPCMG